MGDFGGFCPVEISYLKKEEMLAELNRFNQGSKIVLIADKLITDLLELSPLIEQMSRKYELIRIDRITPNPTQIDIQNALEKIGREAPDKLVAIGGGSTIDVAKALSATFSLFEKNPPTLEQITAVIREKSYKGKIRAIDIIAIPTTAGTGSEVTKWATIWDSGKQVKFSIDDVALYPKQTFIVPELTFSAPKKLVLSTGLDALSHALEAFWAKPSNPVIKDVATIAALRIRQNLKNALKNPIDTEARAGMSRGATLAGIAFSNTRTTACHSISYPITMKYGVEHGFACALTLAQVAEINKTKVPEISRMLEEVFGCSENGLKMWLDDVCAEIQQLTLSSFGIRAGDIPEIAKAAFTAGRMDNNPVDITQEQVIEILEKVK